MKIRCTHCDATYEMEPPLLDRADYRVACSACHRVFRVTDTETPPGDESGVDEEMDQLLAEMEETLAGLEKLELVREPPGDRRPRLPHDEVPEEMADLRATEVPPELLMEPPAGERRFSWGAFGLFLLLALLLAGQLAWQNRALWLDHPLVAELARRWCPYLGCELPRPVPEPSFSVLDGRLEPVAPRRYRLRLLLRNDGSRPAPPPPLQLSLSDDQQRLVARRTFDPPVYAPGLDEGGLESGGTLELELLLAVPSDRISGYEVALVPPPA